MIIKNRAEIETGPLRSQALDLIETGISSVLPDNLTKKTVTYLRASRKFKVSNDTYDAPGRIFIIGGGKASGLMSETIEGIIGPENITDGIVIGKANPAAYRTRRIEMVQASHPVPDDRGIRGMERILALKKRRSIDAGDLVICLISGGGSALMPCPVDGVTLADIQQITSLLLDSGANINEINTVRKHLSRTAGGGLGSFFAPARVISLILSDVVGNDLSTIASGPTYPDPTTFKDAWQVMEYHNLLKSIPESIYDYLKKGCNGLVKETPKSLDNCHNYIIGDNRVALDAMAVRAIEMGRRPHIITAQMTGDTNDMAAHFAEEILNKKYEEYDTILLGGETTPTLPAQHGKGGRNQHYAAISLLLLSEYKGSWTVASVGTDGTDFVPDAAGAIVDNRSLETIQKKGLDPEEYTQNFNSYTLFEKMANSFIITGETGTNVCDIVIYLLGD